MTFEQSNNEVVFIEPINHKQKQILNNVNNMPLITIYIISVTNENKLEKMWQSFDITQVRKILYY